jgi:hypothetical protein
MFRPDKEPSPDYTDLVYEWYSKHTLLVEKVTSKAEWRVLCAVNGYYLEHKMALSREAINSVLTRDSQSKVLHEVMDQYDQYADELTLFHPDDLDTQLDQRKEEYEKYRLQRLFAIGSEIAINEYQLRDKEKTVLRGPESAIKYVLGEFQNGVLIDDRPAVGGTLASLAPGIKDRYEQAEQDREYNDLFIPTGMIAIDNHCGARTSSACSALSETARPAWCAPLDSTRPRPVSACFISQSKQTSMRRVIRTRFCTSGTRRSSRTTVSVKSVLNADFLRRKRRGYSSRSMCRNTSSRWPRT